ncbi:CocE/NonD family hydrolase [Streptomyces sp. PSAA01]|uniref:CocE/NonD family hydrolase n=1 Tax=Streptomyces sp. PSAA01 TaxID=2912762 RepID=UPI001EFF6D99|nr:CocE/NonD family hydrolase [Streptomyces sp. PSAA01]MCG0289005.1 CocE/NonD family hydrolase [Streptomyces sp. PSAA01]
MRKRPAATVAALLTVCTLTGGLIWAAGAVPDQATDGDRTQKTAVATATDSVTHEENERVPEGARWTQHYFPSSDGSRTELHADVLLPEKLPEGAKVPVIMSAGAYFGHSGEMEVEEEHAGPSRRLQDLLEGTDLFDKGYAFVMVDTRGFGGSAGCLDLGGPGDQADVSPARNAKGTATPLLFTHGTAETNTPPVGMEEFLDHHRGPQWAWIGPWGHVRGNERTQDGKFAMGRATWFKETLSFFDEHLKGIDPRVQFPNYAVQDNRGNWRAEKSWPAANRSANLRLGNGSYVDSGAGSQPTPPEEGAGRDAGSFFVWSGPLETATRVTGTPRVTMTAKGEGNVMVKLYDVGADGNAVAFDERVSRLDRDRLDIDLKSTDWTLRAGHRLAVEIGSVRTGDRLDTPSKQKIRVSNARLQLPLDNPAEDIATGGDRAPWLDTFMQINAAKLKPGPAAFSVPSARARQ